MISLLKYILMGLGVSLLYWIWISCGPLFFLTWTEALVFKTGVFLSFEMVILAGIILSKTKK